MYKFVFSLRTFAHSLYLLILSCLATWDFISHNCFFCSFTVGGIGVDYEFQNLTNVTHTFNFTISPGATRSFNLTVIDDDIAEYRQYHNEDESVVYELGVYGSFGVYGSLKQLFCDYGYIYIEDNDGKCVMCLV